MIMRAIRAFIRRLIGLGTRTADDARMSEEMRFHLDRLTERYMNEGFSSQEARRRAAIEFGGHVKHEEAARDVVRSRLLEDFGRDVAYTLRNFARNPLFAATAIVTLALGVGANTVMFGVVNSALIQPLPWARGRHVLSVYETDKTGNPNGISGRDLQDWQEQARAFQHIAGYATGLFNVSGGAQPMRIVGTQVTPNFLDVFGAQPIVGTGFHEPGTALISEAFWKAAYGGGDITHARLIALGQAFPIVGVLPASFDFPHRTQAWVSIDLTQDTRSRSAHNYNAVGDLKPGQDVAAGREDLSDIAAAIARANPGQNFTNTAGAEDLQTSLTRGVKPTLILLSVMVSLVLLIACANIANLLLARGVARRREMTVRLALGAGTGRLLRQLLTESVTLGAVGGTLGIGLALVAQATVRAIPVVGSMPVPPQVSHPMVLAFGFAVALTTSMLFGVLPAIQAARARDQAADSVRGRGIRTGLRGTLLAAQVAVAAVLLVGAMLATRSLLKLQHETLGLNPDNVVVLQAGQAAPAGAPLLERVRAVPGISDAALSNVLPLSGNGAGGYGFLIEGEPVRPPSEWRSAAGRAVSDHYFSTLGIPILQGREFQPSDRGGAPVAIISAAAASAYWPHQNPLGKRLAIPGFSNWEYQAMLKGGQVWFTIVGVSGDVRDISPGSPPRPVLYLSTLQHDDFTALTVFARSALPLDQVRAPLQNLGKEYSPDAPTRVSMLNDWLVSAVAAPRFQATLIGLFGALALILATIGIYGVSAYVTSQRTQEIGVRIALGATSGQVVAGVVRRVALHAAIGLAGGLALAAAGARLTKTLLYGVTATDGVSFTAVAILLGAVTLLAAYWPARGAARVDPMAALRVE